MNHLRGRFYRTQYRQIARCCLTAGVFTLFFNCQISAEETAPISKRNQTSYLVEVLFCRDGILFLGQQTLPSPKGKYVPLKAVGFASGEKPIPAPDPGHEQALFGFSEPRELAGGKPKAPPALPTHYWGAHMSKTGGVTVRVSDLGYGVLDLPKKPGDSRFLVRDGALFRIERITDTPQVLRQDYSYWQQRTKKIVNEAKALSSKAVQAWLNDLLTPRPERTYLVEVLFHTDGVLFLGQETLPTPKDENGLLRAVAFDENGKHIPPPDLESGLIAQEHQKKVDPKKQPPLALTTRSWGAEVSDFGGVSVYAYSFGTVTDDLPRTFGDSKFVVWCGAVFRIERVNKTPECLRQNYAFWQKRTRQILKQAEAVQSKAIQVWLKKHVPPPVKPGKATSSDKQQKSAEIDDLETQSKKKIADEQKKSATRPSPKPKQPLSVPKPKAPLTEGQKELRQGVKELARMFSLAEPVYQSWLNDLAAAQDRERMRQVAELMLEFQRKLAVAKASSGGLGRVKAKPLTPAMKAAQARILKRLKILEEGALKLHGQLYEATGRKPLQVFQPDVEEDVLCSKGMGAAGLIEMAARITREWLPKRFEYPVYQHNIMQQCGHIERSLETLDKLLANKVFRSALIGADDPQVEEMKKAVKTMLELQRENTKELRKK